MGLETLYPVEILCQLILMKRLWGKISIVTFGMVRTSAANKRLLTTNAAGATHWLTASPTR